MIQDSCETALNSSTDVLFTAVAEKSVFGKNKLMKVLGILSEIFFGI